MRRSIRGRSRGTVRFPAAPVHRLDALFHQALLVAMLLLGAAACGAEPPEPAGVLPPTAEEDLLAGGAPAADSLYGAPAAEIVTLTPIEFEVANLPAGWEGARIAILSDLQLGRWADNERVAAAALRRAVEAGGADVIALMGADLRVGAEGRMIERLLEAVPRRPIIVVPDAPATPGEPEEPQLPGELRGSAVRVLRDETAALARAGDTLRIAGLGSGVALLGEGARDELFARLGRRGRIPLLLTTSPRTAAVLPRDAFDLVIAGGTFCGPIDVPAVPRLEAVTAELPDLVPVPGAARLYKLRGNPLFITCGLGYSFVPVRFGAPPEVVLVTLRRAAQTSTSPPSADADSAVVGGEETSAGET